MAAPCCEPSSLTSSIGASIPKQVLASSLGGSQGRGGLGLTQVRVPGSVFKQQYREIVCLSRLAQLDRALPVNSTKERERVLGQISQIWAEAEKQMLISEEAAQKAILKGLSDLNIVGVSELYSPLCQDTASIVQKIFAFKGDAAAVSISPLHVSINGLKGPTLLVRYPKDGNLESYVLKYTNRNEILSTRLYDAFSSAFSDKSLGFFVPKASSVDLESGVHESMGCTRTHLSPAQMGPFKGALESIQPPKNSEDTELMIAERVQGANLLDFGSTKYPHFTEEQKGKFFERLGRLALLDLVIGNTDRLAGVDYYDGSYSLDTALESNLGNVLVEWNGTSESFSLFAIDNGIEEGLSSGPKRESYRAFLEEILQDPDFDQMLAANVMQCMLNGINAQVDEIDLSDFKSTNGDNSIQKIHENLAPLKGALKGKKPFNGFWAKDFLAKGIKLMGSWLKNTALSEDGLWEDSEKAVSLKKYLSESSKDFLEALEERLHVVKDH